MKVHFISIGGSVMHQLAIALKRKGYVVTGTDDEIFEPAKSNLAKEGLLPTYIGWQPALITADIDAVILGMHAKADNPEIARAKELGLTIYSFPAYIYQESREKTRVAVGGSHGKTTTTSMIMHVLLHCQQDFDYLVGARLEGFDQSVKITNAPTIVCEADEYPASVLEKRPKFHFLYPHIAILTGIAWDHINVFPTFEFYLEQFAIFISRIQPNGLLVYNANDKVLSQLIADTHRADIRYQPYTLPDHTVQHGITTLSIEGQTAALKVFGNHNLQNILAAYHACAALGISAVQFVAAIASFSGAAKRLELMASKDTVHVYRDFAHAPSKVTATIEAVKAQFPERQLVAILELHTYSSLNEQFMAEYKHAMDKADIAIVFYAKHALELKRMPPLPKEKVMEGFAKPGLLVMNTKEDLLEWMRAHEKLNHTNLILMSSGNYDGIDMAAYAQQITQ